MWNYRCRPSSKAPPSQAWRMHWRDSKTRPKPLPQRGYGTRSIAFPPARFARCSSGSAPLEDELMTTGDLSDDILLAKEKEELLALLLAENGIAPPGEPIPRRPTSDRPPLSFAQQRLWFVEQLGLTPGAYHIPIHLRLSGDLNPDALARSFTEIVRRHEALRTCFRTAGAEPYQHILDPAAVQLPIVELPVEDLRALAPGRREAEARRLATEETARPFDLAQGPMLRTRLLRLGDDDHILLITMHHVAVDGWSVGILMREMSL